jgi:hypothetical protein
VGRQYYSTSVKLLTALMQLQDDLKHNYEEGDANQKALATIALLQVDLFSSYILLLREDEKGYIVGRAVILRTILENQGAILHIKDNSERAESYLAHVEKIQKQVIDHINGVKTAEEDLVWSTSKIKHRVELIDDSAGRLYDMLSNFTHGNNTLYFFYTKELTEGFIKAIDAYFIGMFIGLLAELAVGLDMDDAKRLGTFDATKEARVHYESFKS